LVEANDIRPPRLPGLFGLFFGSNLVQEFATAVIRDEYAHRAKP
jgi:hypothetical protein